MTKVLLPIFLLFKLLTIQELNYVGGLIIMSIEATAGFWEVQPEGVRPPKDFEIGTIQGVRVLNPADFHLTGDLTPAQIVACDVYNPNIAYLEATKPGRYSEIRRQERLMDLASRLNFRNWRHQRQVAYAQDPEAEIEQLSAEDSIASGDSDSRKRFFSPTGTFRDESMCLWRDMIPQASALTPLVNPFNTDKLIAKDGKVVETTAATQEWWTACTDGQEIFHRSAVMIEEIGSYLGKYAAMHPDQKLTVVSVAGGTALSTMQAIQRSGVNPEKIRLLLLEGNEESAKMAFGLAEKIDFTGEIVHKAIDVFSPTEMAQVKADLDAENAKVVALDAVGIAEYSSNKLRTSSREKWFGKDSMLFDPEKFVESCLRLVSDDGMAVIGQMRADRLNPYFTRGVIGWPHISMRSVRRFARILQGGGADMRLTKLSLTPRDTYSMATIYRSEQGTRLAGLHNEDARALFQQSEVATSAVLRAVQAAGCVGNVANRQTVE